MATIWRPNSARLLAGLVFAGLSLAVVGCGPEPEPTPKAASAPVEAPPAPASEAATPGDEAGLEDFARRLVAQLRDRQIQALGESVHPELGLRFAPYATLSDQDVTLSAAELLAAWDDGRVLNWGHYDGSGEPIALSLPEYFDQFVYDADFFAARVAVNHRLGRGNSLNNLDRFYPRADFVEFHRPGSEQYGRMDWSSLRLVLRPRPQGGWWLLALVHDQWTI